MVWDGVGLKPEPITCNLPLRPNSKHYLFSGPQETNQGPEPTMQQQAMRDVAVIELETS